MGEFLFGGLVVLPKHGLILTLKCLRGKKIEKSDKKIQGDGCV